MNRIAAHWTPDCQGKQDFDGPIIVVSTRYWPQGGGFDTYDSRTNVWESNEDRPEVKPSAHCSIVLRDREDDHDRTLIDENFDADTEVVIKQKVESWANEQRERIVRAVDREFEN